MCGVFAASDVWKGTDGEPGDAYTWGRVEVPTVHGHVIQLTAGGASSSCRFPSDPHIELAGVKHRLHPILPWSVAVLDAVHNNKQHRPALASTCGNNALTYIA